MINDGSTDNTQDVLNKFENIENIHIIEQKNKGFSGARNTGIDFATGRYLMFLDSDDEMLPNSINALLDRAYEYDADIVEGGFRYIYSNGKYSNNPSSNEIKEISMPFGMLEDFFWGGERYIKEKCLMEFVCPKDIGLRIHLICIYYFGEVKKLLSFLNWYTDIIKMKMV